MYNSASAAVNPGQQAQPQPQGGPPAAAGYHHEFLEAAAMCFCHRFLNPFGGSLGLNG